MADYKKCPYCAEDILVDAKKCKHCDSLLDESDMQEANEAVTESTPPPPPTAVNEDFQEPSNSPEQFSSDSSVKAEAVTGPPPPPEGGLQGPPPPPEVGQSTQGAVPPPPDPVMSSAYQPNYHHQTKPTVGLDWNGLFMTIKDLFSGGDLSVNRLNQFSLITALVVIAITTFAAPFVNFIVHLIDMGNVADTFGHLFLNTFLGGAVYNILSLAVLFGLLFVMFEIGGAKKSMSACISMVALVSLAMFLTSILTIITAVVPWITIFYITATLIVGKSSSDTFKKLSISSPLAVMVIWVIVERFIVSDIVWSIF